MKLRLIHSAPNTRHVSAMPAFSTLASRLVQAFLMLLVLCGLTSTATAQKADLSYGKLPLSFEPNRGQVSHEVQFLSRGQGYSLYLTQGEAVLQLQKATRKRAAAEKNDLTTQAVPEMSTLRMKLFGSIATATVAGEEELPGTVNYFEGSDPKLWKTAIPTYKRISYKGVYPGVDLVYYGNQRELEYDFVVAPGANPTKIALGFTGAAPRIDAATGDLVLAVTEGETRFHKPVVYQLDGDRRVPIAGSYAIANNQVHFDLGRYDTSKTLVIDPVLSYLTYLGGSNNDQINGLAVDVQGNVIVVGSTYSTDFPLKNAYSSTPTPDNSRYSSLFVTKFNATGTAVVYSTFLGLSATGNAVAVDLSGNAYAFGSTNDPNYPVTTGAFQTLCGANYNSNTLARITGCSLTYATGNNSTMLTKISPDGSQLIYSTFLSGSNGNLASAVAVNSAGEAYVTGTTNAQCSTPSTNSSPAYFCFPVTANAVDSSASRPYGGDTALFLTKFNAQGTALVYSTFLDNHNPVGHYLSGIQPKAIALDAVGNAYITGYMDGGYFITTTTGALQTGRPNAQLPAFVAKFNPAGTSSTALVYSTYLSGTTNSSDTATGIAVDSSNNAVVTGYTSSCTFPTTAGAFSTAPGGYASQNICSGGFLTKLSPAGSSLVWSTYTGNNGANGRNNDNNDAVALASDGSVYVVGDEQGVALSPTVNPIFTQSESHFTYIKHFTSDASKITFSSAIGGTTDATSIPTGVILDASGNIYLAGYTNSSTLPITAGAFQKASANPGVDYYDGFIVKLAPLVTTTTSLTLPTGTVTAGQSAKFTAKVTGQTGSTGTPTGTVIFLNGSTTLGTSVLDSTGTATYTAASLNATTYTLTASYGGDTSFASSVSAQQSLVVSPATSTVTLTVPATALVGASVTFAVAVTGTGGTPTGTVAFKDGSTTLGTATLSAGVASYSTSSLATGAHSITASYGGDSLFSSAVSSASTVTINVSAAISFAAASTSVTIVHGASGSVVITGSPVGGYTGTVSFACGTLPTAATCVFAPTTLSFTGSNTPQSTTLTVSTITTVALEHPTFGRRTSSIFVGFMLLPLGFLMRGRKRGNLKGLLILVLTLASVSILGMTGCSTGSSPIKTPTTITTPAGAYTIAVTISATSGNNTLNIPVTVQ